MNVQQHGTNLITLTKYTAFNCFLVREDDGFTLVDTGMSGSETAILQAAQAHGVEIKRILLTHAHVDHVGSLDALAAALPDVPVIISEREARLLAGDMSIDADEPQTAPKGGFPDVTTRATQTVTHGDRVGSLQVVAAPGHTPGHIALLDTRDNTLLAGDAFVVRGGFAVSGMFKLFFPFPAFATWHKPTALNSAKALRALNPSRIAVGHGKVLENPAAMMDAAIREAEKSFGVNPAQAMS